MKRYIELLADARTRVPDPVLTLGCKNVVSLRNGLRDWNDTDLPLVSAAVQVGQKTGTRP